MARAAVIPKNDDGRRDWLNNFALKLVVYAASLGVTPAELAAVQAAALFWAWVLDAKNAFDQFDMNWTAYKNLARDGGAPLGAVPAVPALPAAPPAVDAGIFVWVAQLVARIKKHPGCTDAIAQDLGIIGAMQTFDPGSMKPVLDLELQAGHPNVGWTKQGMDGIEIWVDRGDGKGFCFLAIDTIPDYLDTAPLPAAGTSAVWKYKAIYRLNDEQVGQWSDIASISVMGT
jgi:hypothetical protein